MNPQDPNQPNPTPPQQPGVPTPPAVGPVQAQQPGAPLQPGAPMPPQGPQPNAMPSQPMQPMQPGQPQMPQQPGGGSSKKILIILSIVVALLIAGAVLFLVLGGGDDESANSESDDTSEAVDDESSDSESEDSAQPSGGGDAAKSTDGAPITDGYEMGIACETDAIPSNLIASTDTHFRVAVYQESDIIDGEYNSAYFSMEERNRTDFENDLNIDGVACLQRQEKEQSRVDCDYQVDGSPITAKLKLHDYDVTLYDTHTGEEIGKTVVASDSECPSFAAIDANNELFADPDSEEGGQKIAELTKGL